MKEIWDAILTHRLKTVIRLANNGDKDACIELSLRYSTGTALLEKNPAKAEYWRKQSFIDYSGNTSYSNGEKTTPKTIE